MMKKYTLLCAFFFGQLFFAQAKFALSYTTNVPDAENNWVVLPSDNKDQKLLVTYLYYDEMAGYTIHLMGELINENGSYVYKESEEGKTSSMKARVQNMLLMTHVLTKDQLKKLNMPEEPDWMKHYKTPDPDKQNYLKRLSSINGSGYPQVALPKLKKLYDDKMKNAKLYFELAFAYNALQDYENGEKITSEALKNKFSDDWILKEHAYSLAHLNKTKELESFINENWNKFEKEYIKAEAISNMIASMAHNGRLESANQWLTKFKNEFDNNRYQKNISQLESIIKDKQSKIQ